MIKFDDHSYGDAGAPGAPTLTSPANGATLVPVLPTLQWTAVPNVIDYSVQIATDPGFTAIVYNATSVGTSHVVGTALNYNTLYYWRVRARNTCGSGPWSTAFSFTTIPQPPQDLTVSPNNLDLDIFFNCDTAAYNGAFQVLRSGTGQIYAPADMPGDYGILVSYNGCVIGPDVVGQTFDDDWDNCLFSAVTGSGTRVAPPTA